MESHIVVQVYEVLAADQSTHQVTVVDGQASGDGCRGDRPNQGGGRPVIVDHGRAENNLGRNYDLRDPNKTDKQSDFSQPWALVKMVIDVSCI